MKKKSTETFRAWADFPKPGAPRETDRVTSLLGTGPEILTWLCAARERGAVKVGYRQESA